MDLLSVDTAMPEESLILCGGRSRVALLLYSLNT